MHNDANGWSRQVQKRSETSARHLISSKCNDGSTQMKSNHKSWEWGLMISKVDRTLPNIASTWLQVLEVSCAELGNLRCKAVRNAHRWVVTSIALSSVEVAWQEIWRIESSHVPYTPEWRNKPLYPCAQDGNSRTLILGSWTAPTWEQLWGDSQGIFLLVRILLPSWLNRMSVAAWA